MKNFLRLYAVFLFVIFAFALDGCKDPDKKDPNEKPPTVTVRQPRVIESGDSVIIKKEKILFRSLQNIHTVILLVDTENLRHGHPDTVKSYCSFQDLNPGEPIEDYTTDVLEGDSIIWIGKSISATNVDIVKIGKIIRIGGPGDSEAPHFLERQDSINGRVNGLIRHKLDSGYEERYKIRFRVIKEGENPKTYNLDPKILVH